MAFDKTEVFSPDSHLFTSNFRCMSAFICNYHEHWFTIRKIGHQWFNLDSTFRRPKLLSETYLDIYLAQIMAEGQLMSRLTKYDFEKY